MHPARLSPNLTDDYTLSSISPAIGHGTDFRYDFDGLLEGEQRRVGGDARPQPSGTMPDLGALNILLACLNPPLVARIHLRATTKLA